MNVEQRLSQTLWILDDMRTEKMLCMQDTLQDLIPGELISMVLAESSEVRLPITSTYSGHAVVLSMDLCNYSAFVAQTSSSQVARHMHGIFSAFDAILSDSHAVSNGLFKMDTIGDAYVACAFLVPEDAASDGTGHGPIQGANDAAASREASEDASLRASREGGSRAAARERNATTCRCMMDVAQRIREAIQQYNAEHGLHLQCRMGMDAGPVVAGMKGRLQPRFHLLGRPVHESARLEARADTETVNVSPQVLRMMDRELGVVCDSCGSDRAGQGVV